MDPLVRADPNTGEPVSGLAQEWTISDDGLIYTFELDPQTTFSDGSALTPQALASNLERWEALGQQPLTRLTQPYHQLFGSVDSEEQPPLVTSWEIPSDQMLRVTLSRPSVSFPKVLTQPALGIALPAIIGKDGYFTEDPIGTGAFKLDQWSEGSIRLAPNPHYSGAEPGIDVLEFVSLPDAEKRYYSLLQGNVDAFDQIGLEDYVPLALDGYAVQTRDPYAVAYVNINLSHPAFADVLTRQALAQAIDRSKIAADYYPQGTSTAYDFLPALFQTRHEKAREHYGYDSATAASLLKDSTYEGEPIDFYYPVQVSLATLPAPEAIYSVISANLVAAGFNIVPKPYRWDAPDSEDIPAHHPDYGLELTGFLGTFRDPSAFLGKVLAPASTAPDSLTVPSASRSANSPSASPSPETSVTEATHHAEIIKALQAADIIEDVEVRRSAYREINAKLALLLPAIPLTYPVSGVTQGPRVRTYGVEATGLDRFNRIELREGQ
ncbi:ABC transporter substrate-binding protein [Rothia sp. LK2492]|uniref:ABC transporter substrate-binding protein n=1 Tax=Rothia sp. LK2492 TaxID=3114370 RepID=UPI0034CEE049